MVAYCICQFDGFANGLRSPGCNILLHSSFVQCSAVFYSILLLALFLCELLLCVYSFNMIDRSLLFSDDNKGDLYGEKRSHPNQRKLP